ncbi:MAG: Hpt domain-containing protein, partial [Desulfobulbaceae bacterium]|nr:Hpt domain-containing protein [Desulfobulbaceae bacterium]
MAEVKKTSFEHLEAIALKIMMVDPGNLSVIGELIELTEEMVASPSVREMDILWNMSKALRRVLEKIIMGELVDDSAENFELLADCISLMQETNRLKGKPDDEILAKFCNNMNTIGHQIEKNDLTGQDEDQTGRESAKEVLQPEEPVGQGVGAASSEEPVVADFAQDADLINGFIEEALEHLEVIEVNVLDLEQHPDDSDIINNIFRPFHTIKGVSGFLNLKSINKLAHTTENLLDDVRNGVRKMDSAVIDIVLSAGDFLKSMVENVREVLNNGPEYFKEFDISEFVSSVHAVQSGEAEPSAPEPAIEPVAQPPVKQEIE